VREGDVERARQAMRDHLDEAETTMRTALRMRSLTTHEQSTAK
jgi:DNA-binding FadR family transcriptional regulator